MSLFASHGWHRAIPHSFSTSSKRTNFRSDSMTIAKKRGNPALYNSLSQVQAYHCASPTTRADTASTLVVVKTAYDSEGRAYNDYTLRRPVSLIQSIQADPSKKKVVTKGIVKRWLRWKGSFGKIEFSRKGYKHKANKL